MPWSSRVLPNDDPIVPLVCERCFGETPQILMVLFPPTIENPCRVCNRKFPVYLLTGGDRPSRIVHESVPACRPCCERNNICQACLVDLEYETAVKNEHVVAYYKEHVLQGSEPSTNHLAEVRPSKEKSPGIDDGEAHISHEMQTAGSSPHLQLWVTRALIPGCERKLTISPLAKPRPATGKNLPPWVVRREVHGVAL